MSLYFTQICRLTTELAALVRLKINTCMFPLFSAAIDPILFNLAGMNEMHNILYEFKLLPDKATDNKLSYHRKSKNALNGENSCSIKHILMTLPDNSQVSDRCRLIYLFSNFMTKRDKYH